MWVRPTPRRPPVASPPHDTPAPATADVWTAASDTPSRTVGWKGFALSAVLALQSLSPLSAAASTAALPAPQLALNVQQAAQTATDASQRALIDARRALMRADFPAVDPYVASVAQGVDALINAHAEDVSPVKVWLPQHFERPVEVKMGTSQGPHAKMLAIFPGLGSDGDQDQVNQLANIASEHGMNFVVLPNPFSASWLEAKPRHLPGVIPSEAVVMNDMLTVLARAYPSYFEHVSALGCSYGGMLGAATLKTQQEAPARPVINGTLSVVSPPLDLLDSIPRMDALASQSPVSLREGASVGLSYLRQIYNAPFETFATSALAQRGSYSAERMFARYAGPESVLSTLRAHLGARGASSLTFVRYVHDQVRRDPWFAENGSTVEQASAASRLDHTLDAVSGGGVPVMVLTSKDDFILTPQNAKTFTREARSANPDQIVHQFAHGGHLGILYNPKVRDIVGDFAAGAPTRAR